VDVWTFDDRRSASDGARDAVNEAIVGLVGCIGSPTFGAQALQAINGAIVARSWSVYLMPAGLPPRLLASASVERPEIATHCWKSYRRGLYLRDTSFESAAAAVCANRAAITRCGPEDFQPDHRTAIYERHRLSERLSVVVKDSAGAVLALNLYRHDDEPRFGEGDFRSVECLGPAMLACVRRHLDLNGHQAGECLEGIDIQASLKRTCAQLTQREVEVCAGLVRGWTFDGIASHLGLSPTTAKTYRDRAFRRLGIHYRNELFGLVVGAVAAHSRQTSAGK
jgi:DNA-binding CsgD family transcriptional regulator